MASLGTLRKPPVKEKKGVNPNIRRTEGYFLILVLLVFVVVSDDDYDDDDGGGGGGYQCNKGENVGNDNVG
ncbi:hypothetical protein PV325_009912 [Microctonus aethiopoides]|nr:hypothetical protein PV325_009912 [Microctonus aethiopoides]